MISAVVKMSHWNWNTPGAAPFDAVGGHPAAVGHHAAVGDQALNFFDDVMMARTANVSVR